MAQRLVPSHLPRVPTQVSSWSPSSARLMRDCACRRAAAGSPGRGGAGRRDSLWPHNVCGCSRRRVHGGPQVALFLLLPLWGDFVLVYCINEQSFPSRGFTDSASGSMRVTTLVLLSCVLVSHGCELCTAQRTGDGPVFELTDLSFDTAVARHDLLLLLLYKGGADDRPTRTAISALARTAGRLEMSLKDEYLDPVLITPQVRRAVSLSTVVDHNHHSLMIAQIDVHAHPITAHRMGVHEVELPALRLVRGDATYGYKIRAPNGDFVTRTGMAILDELNAPPTLVGEEVGEGEETSTSPKKTADGRPHARVVGTLHSQPSLCAFQQVAHAYRKPDVSSGFPAVGFALDVQGSSAGLSDCPLPAFAPRASYSPPSAPVTAPPPPPPSSPYPSAAAPMATRRPPALPTTLEPAELMSGPERIVLAVQPATGLAPAAETVLEMPLHRYAAGGGPISPKALHAWVHWAVLPKTARLDGAKRSVLGSTHLREGDVGVLLTSEGLTSEGLVSERVHSDSPSATDAQARVRLERLQQRLMSHGRHGLTLLWGARADRSLHDLLSKLGLGAKDARARDPGGVQEGGGEYFAIIRLAGSRFAEVHVMDNDRPIDEPISDEALHAFCAGFLNALHGVSAETTVTAGLPWALRLRGTTTTTVAWAASLSAVSLVLLLAWLACSWQSRHAHPHPHGAAEKQSERGAHTLLEKKDR